MYITNHTLASIIVMLPLIMGLLTIVLCLCTGKHKAMLPAALMIALTMGSLIITQAMGMEPIYMLADYIGSIRN